jgi:hypothetical protein
MEKLARYDHLQLGLENEDRSDEVIDDPEKYQESSKLYYFAGQSARTKEEG